MLTIEFEYTPEEIREAHRAITRRSLRLYTSGRGLMTLVMLFAFVVGVFVLLGQTSPSSPPASQPAGGSGLLNDFVDAWRAMLNSRVKPRPLPLFPVDSASSGQM